MYSEENCGVLINRTTITKKTTKEINYIKDWREKKKLSDIFIF